MQQTVMGKNSEAAQKEIRRKIWLCIAIGCACLAVNIVLLILYNYKYHNLFLALNIVVDVLGCWIIFAYVSLNILPKKRLYELLTQPAEELSGTVDDISEETQKICKLDCKSVKLGGRTVFLPCEGKICVEMGKQLKLYVVSNIVIGVDYE